MSAPWALTAGAVLLSAGAAGWSGSAVAGGAPRLSRVKAAGRPARVPAATSAGPHQPHRADAMRWALPIGVGLAIVVTVGGPWGPGLGAFAWWLARRFLAARARRARTRTRDGSGETWAFAADLLGAALQAGASTRAAVVEVGEALSGPVGVRLRAAGLAWSFGARADAEWEQALAADASSGTRLASVLAAGEAAGLPPVNALRALAAELRAEANARRSERARRAGIAAVAPLGLCFLPAFVLIGVAPVIAAALHGLFR